MLEKSGKIENQINRTPKFENIEQPFSELKVLDNVVRDFAPEVAHLCQFREDEAEEQQIKTGQLHENRILGIFLKFYLDGRKKMTTGKVEEEYKRYFKDIARSTISTYLNMLKREFTLYKERDGRNVYYIFSENPPNCFSSFWFNRIFCTVPAYFGRASYFANLYNNAKKFVEQYLKISEIGNKDVLTMNFKFLTGLIILKIFKNRISKCIGCQFSKKSIYVRLEELIDVAIKDRSDVLPGDILDGLIQICSEIPIFEGISINDNIVKENIVNKILKSANINEKDLEFQAMVSLRRQDLRLKQKNVLEEDQLLL